MAVQDPKDLFVMLLNNVRQNEERTASTLQEISEAVEDPDIREAIESRIFLKNQTLSTLDRCFKLIGEQPKKPSSQLHDAFVEEFRKDLDEIKGPMARTFFIGALLESCLADKLAFVERLRRRIRRTVESEMAVGVA
jgi:ferritin-like metal-binding protein YciE